MPKPNVVEERVDYMRTLSMEMLRQLQEADVQEARDEEIRRHIEYEYSGDAAVLREW